MRIFTIILFFSGLTPPSSLSFASNGGVYTLYISVHIYIYVDLYIYVCVYTVYPSVIKHDNRKSTIQFDDFPAFLNLSFLGDLPLLGFDFRRVCIFSYKQHLWHLWLLYYVI